MRTGVLPLVRLILRRDRIKLPVWMIGTVGMLIAMVPLMHDVYSDPASLKVLYETFRLNPAGLFLTGPMDSPTFGAFFTLKTFIWWGMAIAFMNTLFIVRHTRHNEEIGAQELILSGRVGRSASLVAALSVALILNTLVAIGSVIGLLMTGTGWSAESVWLFGISLGLFGMIWAGIAAVVAQLVASARTANGILAGLIGITFALRGVGDVMGKMSASGLHEPMWLSWISPFGWLQASRPLTYPEWWPLSLGVIFLLVALPFALYLHSRRDVGEGLIPARKGRDRARWDLKTPLGMTICFQRNVFIGWMTGVVAMVLTIGALVPQMSDVYNDSPALKHVIQSIGGTGELIKVFLSAMLAIIVMMIVAYGIQAIGRLRTEETSGHLENILATGISRFQWLLLHTVVVAIGGVIMLGIAGLLLAFSANALVDRMHLDVWQYVMAGLSYAPLLLVFVSAYIMLFGALPRISGLVTWLYYGFMVFILWIGPMLNVPEWVNNLSPMGYLAAAPSQDIRFAPLLFFVVLSGIFLMIGLLAWRYRDIATTE